MFKRRIFTFYLLLFTFTLCFFTLTWGQTTTATLSGTVEDQNSAAVSGATVTIQNKATSFERTLTTGDSGSFSIPLLPPGTYTVTVRRDGFTPIEVRDVVLNVGDQKSFQIQLKVGSVAGAVEVTPEASLVNDSPSVGTTVDRQFVENLPLNGRSFQSLITLTPGVVLVPAGGNNTGQFSVNGQRANSNYFMVDGVSANIANGVGFVTGQSTSGSLPGLTTFGGTNSLVSVDAMQEFKVQTSTYAAEYGRTPGAQISIVTRSGENKFHGSLFDYFRNEVLDANNWFLNSRGISKRPALRQNDFGGVFSGPVMLPRFGEGGSGAWYNGRNKTFFFFSYEGLRLLTPLFTLTNVPTLGLRQSAAEPMRTILNSFPLPNGRDLGNGFAEFATGYSNSNRLNATSIRIDHNLTGKVTVFGRYNVAPSQAEDRDTGNLSVIQFRKFDIRTLTFGTTAIIGNSVSNEMRANFSDNGGKFGQKLDTFGGAIPLPREVLLPSQFAPAGTTSNAGLLIGGFSGFTGVSPGVSINNQLKAQRQVNLVDSFSFSTKAHLIKLGADYRRLMPKSSPRLYILITQFLSLGAVQTGTPTLLFVGSETPFQAIYNSFSAFAQDTWRISPRLTLDIGVRWELNPAPKEANGNDPVAITNLNNFATLALAPQGTPLWKTTYNNFAPRFGAAYQLSKARGRETVLRGGFGVFYDSGNSQGSAGFDGFPFIAQRLTFPNTVPLPFPNNVLVPPITNRTPPYTQEIITFDPNLKLPYTLQWNFAVEQSLGANQAVTASYVAALGRRLLVQQRVNIAPFNSNFTSNSPLRLTTNNSTSDYHSLQLQYQRRLSLGLQALASYTWSHAIDTASTDVTSDVVLRGNADFDIRHNVAAAATYDIPGLKGHSLAAKTLSGWSMDLRVAAASARPVVGSSNVFNITSGTFVDPITGTQVARRANLVQGVPIYLRDPTAPGGKIINRAAFSIPPTGVQGTLGRNVIRGFPFWQADLAVRRQFNVMDRLKLQLRAEAFNVFNHPNFGTIQTSLTAPPSTFGRATDMLGTRLAGLNALYQLGGPRSLQLALKLQF